MTSPYIIGTVIKKNNIEALFSLLFRWTHHGVLNLTISGDKQDPTAVKTYTFTQLKALDIVTYDEYEQEIFKIFFSQNKQIRIGETLPGLAQKIKTIIQRNDAQTDTPARIENIGFLLTFMMRASFFGVLLLLIPYVFVWLSVQRGLQTVLLLGFGLPGGLRILTKIRTLIQIQSKRSNQLAREVYMHQTVPTYEQQRQKSQENPVRRSQELAYHVAIGDYANRCETIKTSITQMPIGWIRESAPIQDYAGAVRSTLHDIIHILIEQTNNLADNENQIN